jgi:fructose-1,6-bisphosphatase I
MTIRRAAILSMTGSYGGDTNASGEVQKKLDVHCNDVLIEELRKCGKVAIIASEEEDNPVISNTNGKYVCVFDPLDGSSNIDASIPVGTIFGIYRLDTALDALANTLQSGKQLVAGGYALYGSAAVIVWSLCKGTHKADLLQSLDSIDEQQQQQQQGFVVTQRAIQMPVRGKSYSLNEGREHDWPEGLKRYIGDSKQSVRGGAKYDLCYVCSLVADAHYVLLYGGIACNPRSHLRLVYEGNPMALVIEQAGGASSTGISSILHEVPQAIHQRIPTFLGSVEDIAELEAYGKQYGGVQQLGNIKYDQ